MAVPALFSQSYDVIASPADATATVVAAVGGVSVSLPGQTVKLHGWINIDTSADTDLITLEVRSTDINGSVINNAVSVAFVTGADSGGQEVNIYVEDPDTNVAGATYVLIVTCDAATTAATVNEVILEARVD